MDTVLFTDHDVLVLTTVASAIVLVLAVLLVSTRVEKGIDRLESKIRQALIHQ
jgi:diacylglycerol kinase